MITIDFVTAFSGVKIDAKNIDMLCKLKVFVFGGVKIDAKKGDASGNFKAFTHAVCYFSNTVK